jgi:hypothetical protein
MAVVDLCAYEDCHTGSYSSVPIKLIASKVAACSENKRAYTTLRYVFIDGSPWPDIPADMNTSGYIASPDRTLPPKIRRSTSPAANFNLGPYPVGRLDGQPEAHRVSRVVRPRQDDRGEQSERCAQITPHRPPPPLPAVPGPHRRRATTGWTAA